MENVDLVDLLADIQVLTTQLAAFEDKYDLRSESFSEWYEAGNEPENNAWVMDFAEWACLYQSRRMLILTTDLENKIAQGEITEHPAWEDLIVAENTTARLEELVIRLYNLHTR